MVKRAAFGLLVALAASALLAERTHAEPGAASAMPGPSPRGRAPSRDVARENAACESCHADIAAEWRGSLHRQAFTNAPFAHSFALEPLAFCQGCHAPEADATKPLPAWARDMGVGCVTCHVVGGAILAAPAATARAAPHPVTRSSAFASEAACATCHEFDFPDGRARRGPAKMQLTVTEHRASASADKPCASCHMPSASGASGGQAHRSHAFAASRSPEWIRSAVRIRATRAGERVHLVLTPARAGHAFPTGDLFRRLEVSAVAEGGEREVRRVRYLTRHFAEVQELPGILVRSVVRDDRVGAQAGAPQTVELDLGPAAAGHAVRWRVSYQRVAHPRGRDERDAMIEGEILIDEGTLAP